jgi:phage tail-like protein
MSIKVTNTAKVFQFRVEMRGIDQWEVQEVNIPEVEMDVVEHGDANFLVKTGGILKFGDITLKRLKKMQAGDTWAWDWLLRVQDPATGGGTLPENYKEQVIIKQLSADGSTTIDQWICLGCFPKKVSHETFNRTSSDNQMETVVLSVDLVRKTNPIPGFRG